MAFSGTMIQAVGVRCQHCGASLQIGDSVRFVTCGYCHTELEVVRDASIVHTALLQRIAASAEEANERLKVIEFQNSLTSLDQDWERWKERYLGRSQDGSLIEPGPPHSKALSLA